MKREIYKLYRETFDAECVPSNQKSCMALNALLVLMSVFSQPYYIPLDVNASCPDVNATQNGEVYWREYISDNKSVYEPALTDFRKIIDAWEKRKNHSFSEFATASQLSSYFSDFEAPKIRLFFEKAALRLPVPYAKEDIGRAASCLLLAYCALGPEECPRIGKYGRTSPAVKGIKPQLFLETKTIFSDENIAAVVDFAVMKHNAEFVLSYDDLISLTEWLLPYALSINTEAAGLNDLLMESGAEKILRTYSLLRDKGSSARTAHEEKLLVFISDRDDVIQEAYITTTGGLYFFGKEPESKKLVKKILSDMTEAVDAFEKLHGAVTPAIFDEDDSNTLMNLEKRRDRDMGTLRQLQAQLLSAELAAAVEHMANRLSVIYAKLIENPKKERSTALFFNYYLPTTVKLLSSFISAEKTGLTTKNIEALKTRVLENAALLVSVFDKQVDAIFREEAFNVDVELAALKGILSLSGMNHEMPDSN